RAHDVTWALVTFADGAVVNFGISYALPANYPTQGQSDRVELLGADGTMIIDDDHMEHLIFSEKGIPAAFLFEWNNRPECPLLAPSPQPSSPTRVTKLSFATGVLSAPGRGARYLISVTSLSGFWAASKISRPKTLPVESLRVRRRLRRSMS